MFSTTFPIVALGTLGFAFTVEFVLPEWFLDVVPLTLALVGSEIRLLLLGVVVVVLLLKVAVLLLELTILLLKSIELPLEIDVVDRHVLGITGVLQLQQCRMLR